MRRNPDLVETSPGPYLDCGSGPRYTYVSPSVTRLLGYSVDEFMAMNPLDVLSQTSRDNVISAFQKELALEAQTRETVIVSDMEVERHTRTVPLLGRDYHEFHEKTTPANPLELWGSLMTSPDETNGGRITKSSR